MFNFQNLEVYKRSLKLSIELSKLASDFPNCYKRIQDQLIGAVISTTLNIAEGSGRFNKKEKRQFYRIAQSSAFELVAILEICRGLGLIKDDAEIEQKIQEICKMLTGLIKSTQKSEHSD